MRSTYAISILLGALLFVASSAYARVVAVQEAGQTFKELAAQFDDAWDRAETDADRLNVLRDHVRRSPYGERGLDRLFGNFEGSKGKINPNIPGLKESVKLLGSPSKSQRRGYAREILYAIRVDQSKAFHFDVESGDGMNRVDPLKTDQDLRFTHTRSGAKVRIEVKDVKPSSQRADMDRLKQQIDKMAKAQRARGETQVLVNRKPIIPELREYAEKRGVKVYDNVVTGKSHPNHAKTFDTVLSNLDSDLEHRWLRRRAMAGGIEMGLGWILLVPSGWALANDVMSITTFDDRRMLALASDLSKFSSGVGFTASGSARLLQAAGVEWKWLKVAAKVGRVSGIVFGVAALGFDTYRFATGSISNRGLVTTGVEGLGATVGGLLGGTLGSVIPVWGTAIGGIAGSVTGAYVSSVFTDYYFAKRDAEQKAALDQFIREYYRVAH